MKSSRYNILVQHEGKKILFNGLSGAMLELDTDTLDCYNKHQSNPDEMKLESPAFFDALKKTKIFINDDFDEMEHIRKRNQKAVYEDKHFELTINPTMDCNFKCWYCYESHVPGKMSEETRDSVIKMLENLISEKKISGVHLSWFGGEPLMAFDEVIYPIGRKVKDLCETHNLPLTSHITTNAFILDERRAHKMNEIGLNSFQITLDGNEERHNKVRFLKGNGRPTFERVVRNINVLLRTIESVSIGLRINFENETLEHIQDIVSLFDESHRDKMKVDFQRVWQTSGTQHSEALLKTKMELFRDHGYRAYSGSNDFELHTGKKCYADKWYQMVVNWDGNVYKCTARDFVPGNAEGTLQKDGSVSWKDGAIEARFKQAPFERSRCQECNLLPMCMGPCTQHAMEAGEERVNDYCWLDDAELTVDDFVINRYRTLTNQDEPIEV